LSFIVAFLFILVALPWIVFREFVKGQLHFCTHCAEKGLGQRLDSISICRKTDGRNLRLQVLPSCCYGIVKDPVDPALFPVQDLPAVMHLLHQTLVQLSQRLAHLLHQIGQSLSGDC
jgi:hypothetical protein